WSIPTSRNSLTITATRRPCSAVRMRLSSVVLPDPRKPVRIMTEALEFRVIASGVIAPCRWVVPSALASRSLARFLPGRLVDSRHLHLADNPANRLAVLHLHVAPHDCVNGHAFDLPAAPWRRMVLAVEFVRVDGPFLVHIDDGEIAVGAEPDCSFLRIHLPDLGDIFALHLDVVIESHAALIDLCQDQGNIGFNAAKPGDAVPNRGL